MGRWSKNKYLRYCSPTPKMVIFGGLLLIIAGFVKTTEILLLVITQELRIDRNIDFSVIIKALLYSSALIFVITILEHIFRINKRNIMYMVRKSLCDSSFGNPLHLVDGEIEPGVKVHKTTRGYKITIECLSADFDDVASLETDISGCLRNKFGNYAVVAKEEDIAGRYVEYFIEDVISNYYKQSIYADLSDVPTDLTKMYIRKDVYIDYSHVLNSSAKKPSKENPDYILGHADAETTLQIYTDATKDLKKAEMINFEDYFKAQKMKQTKLTTNLRLIYDQL